MLLPILHEIASKLDTLISSGQNGIFDLTHEPLNSGEVDELKSILGQGEIHATLHSLGKSNIRETAVSGVWWITHFNEQGALISECIEVTTCPDLLKTFPDELVSAQVRLKNKIAEYTHRLTPDQIANRLNELGFGVGRTQRNVN